jgi:hypothetical protein
MNSKGPSMASRPGHRHTAKIRQNGRLVRPVLERTKPVHLLVFPLPALLSALPAYFVLHSPMRGCLKHHSPPNTTTIATPPPTRDPTPPLIPPETPSLAIKRRPPPSLSDECLARRCVHFCSELVDKIYVADEWDRSPAEVTPRLTYQ